MISIFFFKFWIMYIYSNKQNDEMKDINEQLARHWLKVLYTANMGHILEMYIVQWKKCNKVYSF
jgi:hypothetical protein